MKTKLSRIILGIILLISFAFLSATVENYLLQLEILKGYSGAIEIFVFLAGFLLLFYLLKKMNIIK